MFSSSDRFDLFCPIKFSAKMEELAHTVDNDMRGPIRSIPVFEQRIQRKLQEHGFTLLPTEHPHQSTSTILNGIKVDILTPEWLFSRRMDLWSQKKLEEENDGETHRKFRRAFWNFEASLLRTKNFETKIQ